MEYTPEQEQCIMSLVGPVDVSAGAGSGKTFTLTQRIAHALADPESGIDDIDQVLAITFTKKAAAELKGRVRSTLRAQGMFDQARKVDGAWISTIHGMCARILRASALEIGIDPGFSVMENATQLLDQALNEVLEESRQNNYHEYAQLFAAYEVNPSAFGGDSVMGLLNSLLNEIHGLPRGFDDLRIITSHDAPSQLARQLLDVYQESLALMAQVKESATQAKNVAACEEALEALEGLLAQGEVTTLRLREALDSCKRLNGSCGSKEQKALIKDVQATYDQLVVRALMCASGQVFEQLLNLGRKVEERFAAKKRSLSVLDNGDLIRQALQALEHEQVAANYADKFRLVMVDEFQDTDALQLAIVSKLSGAGNRYLCTVGDAQQSIYRFRGADVALYRSYQREMFGATVVDAGGQPQGLRLTRNFRSHGDILAFVKQVCAQETVFGQDFLDLQPVYDGAGYRSDDPRIFVDITRLPKGKAEEVGGKGDALQAQAQRLVAFFDRMRQAGHDLSQMVLLLGTTTNADLYAQALRQAGFDCVISGGSLFAKSEEAQHMVHLSRTLVNLKDTEALANVLMGPLFQVSANDLYQLGTAQDEASGASVKATIDAGLAACAGQMYGGYGSTFDQEHPALAHATELLYGARRSLHWQPLSQALLWLLWQSGCFARLEQRGAEGCASMGNYMKALRLMEAEEAKGEKGPAQVAAAYATSLEEGLKEAPGSLNVHDQQAIRIMTIHASKGLEFPIVALADFAKDPRSSNLLLARFEGATYGALFPKGEKIGTKNFGKSEALGLISPDEEANTAVLQGSDGLKAQVLLQRCALADEVAEGQRLFYVGATRAKEALGLFFVAKDDDDRAKCFPGAYGDVISGLFGEEDVPAGDSFVEYGGSQPAWVRCAYYQPAEEETPVQDDAPAALLPMRILLQMERPCMLNAQMWTEFQEGLFSYSSLEGEHLSSHELAGLCVSDEDEDASAAGGAWRRATADDDKATDFGLALHRLCQLSCLTSARRSLDQVKAAAATYGVANVVRLEAALQHWLDSRAYQRALQAAQRLPEQPFAVTFAPTGETLEGVFDLLCVEAADGQRKAYVVDYKTGGQPSESLEALQKKHGLQAFCYAYALLKEGFDLVEMDFVRVEQDDPTGVDSLQTVSFRFDADALEQVEAALTSRRASRS